MIIIKEIKDVDELRPWLKEVVAMDKSVLAPYEWKVEQFLQMDFRRHLLLLLFEGNETGDQLKDENLVAFLLAQINQWEELLHLLKIGSKAEKRKKGYGERLLEALSQYGQEQGLKRIILEVAQKNSEAISFYMKRDFLLTHKKSTYYSDGEDAFFMERNISSNFPA